MKHVEFDIEGMKCEGCVNRVKAVISKIKGVIAYEISLEDKKLVLDVKNEKVLEEIITKIENLGFTVSH